MTRLLLVCLLLVCLLLAAPASAQTTEDRLFHGLQLAQIGTAAIDGALTVECVQHIVGCHEANPIMRPFVDQHGIVRAMTGKVAVNAGIGLGALWLWQRYPEHKRLVITVLSVFVAGNLYADIGNYRTVTRGTRQ